MRRATMLLLITLTLALLSTQPSVVKRVAADCGDPECQMPEGGCPGQVWVGEPWCECLESPIIIDLNNDGYHLTNPVEGVRFDLHGNGKPRQWAWTSRRSDEAFLVLDRNGDGQITDGKELFGNNTDQPVTEEPNGFVALATFDTNGDRWVDANDAIYRQLQLWIDSNHDGVSQSRELFSLSSKGVERIACNYRVSKRSDRHGNRFRYKAMARINGVECWVWDVFFLPLPNKSVN